MIPIQMVLSKNKKKCFTGIHFHSTLVKDQMYSKCERLTTSKVRVVKLPNRNFYSCHVLMYTNYDSNCLKEHTVFDFFSFLRWIVLYTFICDIF